MLYRISRINRTVELNDDLVNEYIKYDKIHEQPFSIVVRTKFGHAPTSEEISDEDLSLLCNEVLLSELKALSLLPQAISVIENNYANYSDSSKSGMLIEYQL